MVPEIAGIINTTSLRFEWEIDSDTIKSKNVGECLESPKFTANTSILLYPKGIKTYSGEYLLFILYYIDDNSRCRLLDFNIVNDKGDNIAENKHVPLSIQIELSDFRGECISRNYVENPANGILRNNTLKFSFESTLKSHKLVDMIGNVATNQEVDLLLEAIDKYEALLGNSKFSDVSLISEGKTLKAHKCILTQSSPVFSAMFDAEMKEKQDNTVEIADVKYDVLVEMIRFVYAGKVNNIDALASELAVAADKYALDSLKNMCEKTMMKNMSLDNVIGCLQIADKIRMNNLKKKAIECIVHNASDVSDRPEFKLLSYDIVCEVFRCLAKKKF